jgi:hypothetical protein
MNLRELFDAFDEEKIIEQIEEKTGEYLHLDFKRANSDNLSNTDDKKNFSRALSGFANAEGGLIIWGVETTKEDGVELPDKIKHIKDLRKFEAKLNEFTSQWVSPPVSGVMHKTIEMPKGSNKGCAVSLIPESDSGPHMSTCKDEKRYYRRSGDAFRVMEHNEVADMFGRRPHPKLDLYHRIVEARTGTVHGDVFVEYNVVIGVENKGRGTAKYPSLTLEVNKPFKTAEGGLDEYGNWGLPRLVSAMRYHDPKKFGGDSNKVVHPKTVLEVLRIKAEIPIQDYLKNPSLGHDIRYEISSEGMEPVKGTYTVDRSELAQWLREHGSNQAGVQI